LSRIVLGVFTDPLLSNTRPIGARIGSRGNVFTESLPSNGYIHLNIVTDLLSALLSNGSVNKPQQRDRFYVVRDATVATQRRGKHISALLRKAEVNKRISAAIGRHATMRNA
jgi:hypothetical protein